MYDQTNVTEVRVNQRLTKAVTMSCGVLIEKIWEIFLKTGSDLEG